MIQYSNFNRPVLHSHPLPSHQFPPLPSHTALRFYNASHTLTQVQRLPCNMLYQNQNLKFADTRLILGLLFCSIILRIQNLLNIQIMKGINLQFEGIVNFIDRTLQNKSINQTVECYLLNIQKITLETLKIINIVFTNVDSKQIPAEVVKMYDKTVNKFKEYFKNKPKPQIQKQEKIYPEEDEIQKYLDNRPQLNEHSNLDERSQLYKFLSQTEEKEQQNKMMLLNIPKFSYGANRHDLKQHQKHYSDIKTNKGLYSQMAPRTVSQIFQKQSNIFAKERLPNIREIGKQFSNKEVQTDSNLQIFKSLIQNYIKQTTENGQNVKLQTQIYGQIFSKIENDSQMLQTLLKLSKQRKSSLIGLRGKNSMEQDLQNPRQQQQKQNKQKQQNQMQTEILQLKAEEAENINKQKAKIVQNDKNDKKVPKGGKDLSNRRNSVNKINSKRDSTKRDSIKRDSIITKKNNSLKLSQISGNRWKKKQTQRQSLQTSQKVIKKTQKQKTDESIQNIKNNENADSEKQNATIIIEENAYLQNEKQCLSKELTFQNNQKTIVQQNNKQNQNIYINRNSQQSQVSKDKQLSYKQHLSFQEDQNNPFQFSRANQSNWQPKNQSLQHTLSNPIQNERRLPQIAHLSKYSINSEDPMFKNKTFYQQLPSKKGKQEFQRLQLKNSKHSLANLHSSMHLTSPQFLHSLKYNNNSSLHFRQKLLNINNLPSTINEQLYFQQKKKGKVYPLSKGKQKQIQQQDNRIIQQLTEITTKKGKNYEWTKIIKNIRDYESIHLNCCGQNCKHLAKFYQFLKNKNLSMYINRKFLVLPKKNLQINSKFF